MTKRAKQLAAISQCWGENLGMRLWVMRARAGMTQAELAARMRTSVSTISRLENPDYRGHTYGSVRRFAEACGYSLAVRLEAGDAGARETPA